MSLVLKYPLSFLLHQNCCKAHYQLLATSRLVYNNLYIHEKCSVLILYLVLFLNWKFLHRINLSSGKCYTCLCFYMKKLSLFIGLCISLNIAYRGLARDKMEETINWKIHCLLLILASPLFLKIYKTFYGSKCADVEAKNVYTHWQLLFRLHHCTTTNIWHIIC